MILTFFSSFGGLPRIYPGILHFLFSYNSVGDCILIGFWRDSYNL